MTAPTVFANERVQLRTAILPTVPEYKAYYNMHDDLRRNTLRSPLRQHNEVRLLMYTHDRTRSHSLLRRNSSERRSRPLARHHLLAVQLLPHLQHRPLPHPAEIESQLIIYPSHMFCR